MDKTLVLFFRDDLASLREPEQAAKQASIATIRFMQLLNSVNLSDIGVQSEAQRWAETVALAAEEGTPAEITIKGVDQISALELLVDRLSSQNIPCALIKDPTYRLKDGSTTHSVPATTGCWAFLNVEELPKLWLPKLWGIHPFPGGDA
ncbi:hypothetical protein [Salipiger sp. PrR003]|uniref:hypothetical protein n=1 Tax=Salipiger sp. PrR003 TaxID=2706776 RepID=UPI0013DA15A4|nr:hypothetical protein [Salipiger sp. PrR003]NDV50383.1 hypothetical protein [Salipiger sp. PrR003]